MLQIDFNGINYIVTAFIIVAIFCFIFCYCARSENIV